MPLNILMVKTLYKRMMWEEYKGQRLLISAMKQYLPIMVGLNLPQLYHTLKTYTKSNQPKSQSRRVKGL